MPIVIRKEVDDQKFDQEGYPQGHLYLSQWSYFMFRRGASLITAFLLATLFITGCSSSLTAVSPTPPAKYEKLGPVSGSATGSIGILATAYNFIPMGLNTRVERAYQDALSKAPGATSLMDVTYQETWYWWVIGTARKVTITGEAIKEIK